MRKFQSITFKTELNNLPLCSYDSEQIQHLLVQLFTNSAEAKKDATITIKSFVKNNSIKIVVEDNGPGIPADLKNDLFNLFKAGKSSYGLFLCRSILDRHRGAIEFIEQPVGTAFEITLPLN
jgi:signal transduction histidine kinase